MLAGYFCMGCDIAEDGGKGADLEGGMPGDGDVMFPTLNSGQTLVASGAASDGVAESR